MLRCQSSYVLLARLPLHAVAAIDRNAHRLLLVAKVRSDELKTLRASVRAFQDQISLCPLQEAGERNVFLREIERNHILREIQAIANAYTQTHPLLTRFDDVEDFATLAAELRGWSDTYGCLVRMLDPLGRLWDPQHGVLLWEIMNDTGQIMQRGLERMSQLAEERTRTD